jgi:hypothetical protein
MSTKKIDIQYTESEIDQLCVILGSIKSLVSDVLPRIVIETIQNYYDHIGSVEICLYSEKIDTKEYEKYEPHGEAKYFTILRDNDRLYLQFWRRHLRRFLFQAELKEMPLLINSPIVCKLAAWRLRLGK